MSKGPKVGEKKKFNLPHVFIILFCIMIICAIATYIIPAGTFDYMENDSGRQVAMGTNVLSTATSAITPTSKP